MSVVSSQFSFRSSPPWKIDVRVLNIMDSIYAIAFGLGLRTLVDAVSQDFKLTGSLIGLWEGVIMLHFLKKMPKSSDPYVAYGVRLFVDLLVTESIERLVLVLIWTAFGMVLADVAPAVWDEVGFKRVWRHFRRDLYTIYDRIPKVAFFPPPRTVRFLPPRELSVISPSITTSQDTPIAIIPPSSSVPSEPLKRRVPGHFPGDYSDTDTDLGSTIRSRPSPRTEVNDALGTTHYRLSTMPRLNHTYSVSDLDDGNQSSIGSSSGSTEMGDPPSFNQEDIPDMEEEEEQALVDIKEAIPDPTTPKQKPIFMPMPPTPSDSAPRWEIHRGIGEDVLHTRPRPDLLPDIPDSMEEGGATSGGWEEIHLGELDEDRPPIPPAKDRPVGGSNVPIPPIPIIPFPNRPVPPMAMGMNMNMGSTSTNPLDIDYQALDLSPLPQIPRTTTEQRRESIPPPYAYVDEYEDIYYNSPPSHDNKPTTTATVPANDNANVNEHVKNYNNNDNNTDNDFAGISLRQTGDFDINLAASTNPWESRASTLFDAAMQAQANALKEEAVKKQAEERTVKKEEAERVRKDEERIRKEQEAEKKKKADETERKKKEVEDDALRKRKQKEAAVLEEAKLKEEEERRKEEKRKDKEEAEQKRRADEEAKRKEEERKKKEEEEEKKKKDKEEAEQKRKEEEKKKEEEEVAKRKKEEEEKKRMADEEAKRKEEEKKKEEEEEKKRKDKEEAERKKKADEEAKRKEEKKKEEEEEKKRKDKEEAEQKRKVEEEIKQKQEEKEEQRARDAAEKQRQEEADKQKRAEEAENKRKVREEADKATEADAETQEKLKNGVKEADKVATKTEVQQVELDKQKTEVTSGQAVQVHDVNQNPETHQHQGPSTTANTQNTIPSPPRGDFMEEESTMSEATVPPEQAKERLERMMTLRAQMVEVEKQLSQLKEGGFDEQSPQVTAVEKSLRKFQRQAKRRYAAGVRLAEYLGSFYDDGDDISFEGLQPRTAGIKLEEKLEELLAPTSRSISFTLTFSKRLQDAKKQKPVIVEILSMYNLTNYTRENANNNRKASIIIPEEHFAEWLTGYRALVARREAAEDDTW